MSAPRCPDGTCDYTFGERCHRCDRLEAFNRYTANPDAAASTSTDLIFVLSDGIPLLPARFEARRGIVDPVIRRKP